MAPSDWYIRHQSALQAGTEGNFIALKQLFVIGLLVVSAAGSYLLGRQSVRPTVEVDLTSREVLEAALSERDELERSHLFAGYMLGLNPDNLEQTLDVIAESGRRLSKRELELLMLAWTRFDAEGAFWRAIQDVERQGRRTVGAVAYAWAAHDPVAAQSALIPLKGDKHEEYLLGKHVEGLVAGGHIDSATEFVMSMPASARRQFLTGVIANKLGEASPADAIAWAEGVPASRGFKKLAFKKTTTVLARTGPRLAAAWLEKHLDEPYAEGCVWVLAWNWVGISPEDTFEWLVGMPPGRRRAEAVQRTFSYWFEVDGEKAERWLGWQSPHAILDPAVQMLSVATLDTSPMEAMNWARRIHEKSLREATMVKVAKAWMSEDPNAARKWLSVSDLPIGIRQAIRDGSS